MRERPQPPHVRDLRPVGCCESPCGDARRHALVEGHPVIVSLPVHRGFTWYEEEDGDVD